MGCFQALADPETRVVARGESDRGCPRSCSCSIQSIVAAPFGLHFADLVALAGYYL